MSIPLFQDTRRGKDVLVEDEAGTDVDETVAATAMRLACDGDQLVAVGRALAHSGIVNEAALRFGGSETAL